MLIPPNKSDKVSFRAKETANPPTPKAVISGVIETPNVWRTNKNPNAKIVKLTNPLKIPVEGNDVFESAQTSNKPRTILDDVILIDITKQDRIILGKYIPNGSGKLASLAAIDRDARKNQKTIIELKALITTSSPFQELLSDNNFILLKRNRLKTNPKNVPITTIPISVTIFICKNSIFYLSWVDY